MMELEKLLARALVLVAHPDDETIGATGLMQRTRDAIVVFATDGAPRGLASWQSFGSRQAYANQRKNEALQVLDMIGIQNVEFLADRGPEAFVDQELFWRLPEAFAAISELVRAYTPRSILTLAYEGGHPDHDCCAFLGARLADEFSLPIWEMPLYHRNARGEVERQMFPTSRGGERVLELSRAELDMKEAMLQAYASQQEVLKEFGLGAEVFRRQAEYDFGQPPHESPVNYELWNFPVKSSELCSAFRVFQETSSGAKENAA